MSRVKNRRVTAGWSGAAAVALLFGLTASSEAATAGVSTPGKYADSSRLFVMAAPGERNHIVLTNTADGIRVMDAQPVIAGAYCESQPDGSAVCREVPHTPRLQGVYVGLGDLDDSARAQFDLPVGTRLSGGDDVLTASQNSPTTFLGGDGDDVMTGGSWADLFLEGSAPNGSDSMEAGSLGPNRPLDAFFHADEVSYADRDNPIRADLEGDPDDGERGERDQIGSDVESIEGGAGGDTLVGDENANSLNGGHGADLLIGSEGDDRLIGGPRADKSADRLSGGEGLDYLYGGGGDDRMRGGPSRDELRGGEGRDVVRGGTGQDVIYGGPGNDLLRTRDGLIEAIFCGGGFDRFVGDRLEQLTDCERRLRA